MDESEEIANLKADILFLREFVDEEMFRVHAESVRCSNHDDRYENTEPDTTEYNYNRILSIWDE